MKKLKRRSSVFSIPEGFRKKQRKRLEGTVADFEQNLAKRRAFLTDHKKQSEAAHILSKLPDSELERLATQAEASAEQAAAGQILKTRRRERNKQRQDELQGIARAEKARRAELRRIEKERILSLSSLDDLELESLVTAGESVAVRLKAAQILKVRSAEKVDRERRELVGKYRSYPIGDLQSLVSNGDCNSR
jgi:hypothetical protein